MASELSSSDKAQLLVALQNGIGLCAACEMCMFDIQAISKAIQADRELHASCIRAIKSAVATNLEFAQKLKTEKKFREWHLQQAVIRGFISELTLWESFCKKEELSAEKVMRAAMLYKSLEECATALGLYREEFVYYCLSNEALALYLHQKSIYRF